MLVEVKQSLPLLIRKTCLELSAPDGTQSSNSNQCTESNAPCCHVTTQSFQVYQESGQSITLPLDSVQSSVHMSTVKNVKAPAVPQMKLTFLPPETNRNGDTGVSNFASFPLDSVKMSGDNCIDTETPGG